MRNRMAHGYFETDYTLVWETVSVEIPRLIATLSARLGRSGPDGSSEPAN
jgi:uncharacterized protein with HEPN domain